MSKAHLRIGIRGELGGGGVSKALRREQKGGNKFNVLPRGNGVAIFVDTVPIGFLESLIN